MSSQIEQNILEKYEILQQVCKGPNSIVWKAKGKGDKQIVALKKVFDAWDNVKDAQRTYREVFFLMELDGHENIIRLHNIIKAKNNKDLYLVFDFMEAGLDHVIRANILQEIHKKYIMYQLFKALKYIHSAELIHCDLKTSHIFINEECHIKIDNFGIARCVTDESEEEMIGLEDYIPPRWYRAPESILGCKKYSQAQDMWSLGCILGELVLGKPIFPGISTIDSIERIMQLTGKPSSEDIEAINSQYSQALLGMIKTKQKKSFQEFFPSANEVEIDLLEKMLVLNPGHRLKVEEALNHKYVEQFVSPAEEMTFSKIITFKLNDQKNFTIKEYRNTFNSYILKKNK